MKKILFLLLLILLPSIFAQNLTECNDTKSIINLSDDSNCIKLNPNSTITGNVVGVERWKLSFYFLVPVIVTISFVFIFIILIILGRILVRERRQEIRKERLRPVTGLIDSEIKKTENGMY